MPSISSTFRRNGTNLARSNKEMTEFLTSEIELEKSGQKKSLPALNGWKITADGSNLTLTKTINDEVITIRANINHSVDASDNPPDDDITDANKDEVSGEMVCRPDFSIEIKRSDKTLGINCSFTTPDVEEDTRADQIAEINDMFQIDEISIFDGEFKENSYAVSGDVMDGNMYDLLMDMLQERGIDDQFGKKLIEYSTVYEHSQYVAFLEKLRKFVSQ